MSDRYDAIVIGGGLLGAALTWMLARDGGDVALLERDQVNAHASGQNAGSLHFQLEYRMVEAGLGSARQAAEAMPLHLHAADLWADLADMLDAPLGVVRHGGLMLAETSDQARVLEAKAEIERDWGLDVRTLTGDESRELAPYLSRKVLAANFCSIEGKADTRIAAPAFARAALRLGAHVYTRRAAIAITRDAGRWRVRTRQTTPTGEVVYSDVFASVIAIAAGVWTAEIGDLLGAHLATIPLALTMTVTTKQPRVVDHLVQHAGARLSLKQSGEGNMLIGGGWPARLLRNEGGRPDLDRRPELMRASVAANIRAAIRVVPELEHVPGLRTWVGTTTVTPDQLPLVGPVPGAPGIFVATGGSAFTLGPSFAQALTDLIAGRRPVNNLSPYDPARFGVR